MILLPGSSTVLTSSLRVTLRRLLWVLRDVLQSLVSPGWVMDTHSGKLGWWFQIKYFFFASLGEMIPILTNRWRRYFSNWWTPTTKGKDGRWCWFSGTCVAANSLACHRGTIDARTTAGNADGKSLHLTYIYVIPSCMDIIFIESNRELWASARNLHK